MSSTRTTVSPLALIGDSNASDRRSPASKRRTTNLSSASAEWVFVRKNARQEQQHVPPAFPA
eukprot:854013-Amphidinium_carterae.2